MFDRFISSLVALTLAFLVWLYVRSRDQEMMDNVPIPVQIRLAPELEDRYELEMLGPSQVPVSFTGPPSRMRELRHLLRLGELHVEVVLNAPEEDRGESSVLHTVRIDAADIHPPPGVTPLVGEGHNRIPVKFHRLVERRLPVHLDYTGDRQISQASIEPAKVMVRGPKETLDRARFILTQPVALPLPDEPTSAAQVLTTDSVSLVQQLDGRRIRVTPAVVAVRVVFEPQQRVYELADVPVQFLCPANFMLRALFSEPGAGKIRLRLTGPAGEEAPAVIAFVDLCGRKWEPGVHEEPLKVQLPANFRLVDNRPRHMRFQLVPLEAE